jgi:hypothetical protein
MNHKYHSCNYDTCNVCNGGLAWCTVCGGAEIELPTECPGRAMTEVEKQKIADGSLFYYGDSWKTIVNEERVQC